MTASFLHGVEVAEFPTASGVVTAPATSVIGLVGTAPLADPALFPLDTPVLIVGPGQAALLGTEGTAPWALAGLYDQARPPVVFVRVDTSPVPAIQQGEVVGDPLANTGVYALLAAQSLVALKPKILIAPGFTDAPGAAGTLNPVVAALKTVAAALRAIYVVDGPGDTDAHATALAALVGDARAYIVDPAVKVSRAGAIVVEPASARVAGVIAASDADPARGYWWSPSNQVIQGVLGVSRLVTFGLSDADTGANALNAAGVATIVSNGGFRLWGNRTSSTDPDYAFLAVRRCWDIVEEAVDQSYVWAMDRPQSAGLLASVVRELSAFLRTLKAKGAVLGGRAFLDPELNTADALRQGHGYVDFDGEPPAPLERLTFNAIRNPDYYADLVAAANAALASNTASAA